jgi:sulfoxide reductase heme-binding subunit YedZ
VIAATSLNAFNPSPLWFATRGAGVVTLVLLTATVVLGIATSLRWEGRSTPRFVTATVHRNLSLFALVLLAVHIATSVLDPFAGISSLDAVVPFVGAYRRFWLGMGVLAAEVLAAVALSSLMLGRIGPRVWRLVHWGAYASWPLAVVHGLGTGSDSQAPWLIGLTAACVTVVLIALADRLLRGRRQTLPVRVGAASLAIAAVAVTCVWAVNGPFQPGWAKAAGTPASILAGTTAPGPVHAANTGFSDALIGTMTTTQLGPEIGLRDTVDTQLTVTIMPPDATQSLPVLSVARGGRTVCTAPARTTQTIYAVCGTTRVVVALFGSPPHVTGRLTTSGSL